MPIEERVHVLVVHGPLDSVTAFEEAHRTATSPLSLDAMVPMPAELKEQANAVLDRHPGRTATQGGSSPGAWANRKWGTRSEVEASVLHRFTLAGQSAVAYQFGAARPPLPALRVATKAHRDVTLELVWFSDVCQEQGYARIVEGRAHQTSSSLARKQLPLVLTDHQERPAYVIHPCAGVTQVVGESLGQVVENLLLAEARTQAHGCVLVSRWALDRGNLPVGWVAFHDLPASHTSAFDLATFCYLDTRTVLEVLLREDELLSWFETYQTMSSAWERASQWAERAFTNHPDVFEVYPLPALTASLAMILDVLPNVAQQAAEQIHAAGVPGQVAFQLVQRLSREGIASVEDLVTAVIGVGTSPDGAVRAAEG